VKGIVIEICWCGRKSADGTDLQTVSCQV